jgi:glycine oxidase
MSGGVLQPRDGAVDNAQLTDALASIASGHPRIRVVREAAVRLEVQTDSVAVTGAARTRITGGRLVLAAGAWSGGLEGLPRSLPVRPVRGQLCTVRGAPLRHVILAPDAYMVTRSGDRTLVGSTMEEVGFEVGTTPDAIDAMRAAAASVCPALGSAPVIDAWSGLRPVTPDLLPILGPDPEYPALLYACGHSRNGILLAPITAAATCAAVLGETPPWDLAPFAIERFISAVIK